MVRPSPALGGAQPPSSSGEEKEQRPGEPNLLWLLDLTGADIGLPPIPQDPDDRCTIWENLVSLVDFQCPGFPLTSEEICQYIDIPPPRWSVSSSSASSAAAGTVPPPRAVPWSPPPPGDIDYKANPHVKPPYSYATLICMAMEGSHKPKLTLADICKWIRDNFSYFRRAHPSWQSSVRHNLCINKRFVKVPRDKGEPGRGAYWKLHPQYAEWLKNSKSERRGALPEQIPPVSGRRTQPGAARRAPSPARGSLEVGAELQRLLQEFEEFESSQNCDPVVRNEEGLQCPQPCPTAEGLPCPTAPVEIPSLPGCAPQEPGELTELKGSADWEALFSPSLEPDFSSLDHLELPDFSPPELFPLDAAGEQGWLRGEQQTLPEPSLAKPGSDETPTAAAFLEAAWNEEVAEKLPRCFPPEQGDGNLRASLGSADLTGWDSLDPFKSLLEMGEEVKFDWI